MSEVKIPRIAVRRLSIYCRYLEELAEQGDKTVSSNDLAEMAGVKAAQLRRDLSYFGRFGVRGKGYSVSALKEQLSRILGSNRTWPTVIVGAGSLGKALALYQGFSKHGINVQGLFDVDTRKIGSVCGNVSIMDARGAPDFIKRHGIRLAMIAVPAVEAQDVAEDLARAGVSGIMNFAPVHVRVPKRVKVYHVDLSIAFETLTYDILHS